MGTHVHIFESRPERSPARANGAVRICGVYLSAPPVSLSTDSHDASVPPCHISVWVCVDGIEIHRLRGFEDEAVGGRWCKECERVG